MPTIAAVTTIDFPYKVPQSEVKAYARQLFLPDFPQVERLLPVFDNTEILSRNFCKPLHEYAAVTSFEDNNRSYISMSLDYSVQAIEACLAQSGIHKEDITDILFVSSTGMATPSLDALIVNRLRLDPHIRRMAVFGLGCAGGVSGMAKANTIARANPEAIVLLVTVELCSLTFLRNDYSKSNFVASSLFSDGVAACIIRGDHYQPKPEISITASGSKLYFDTLDVMGWDFLDDGFKVQFSQNIPALINKNIKADISSFLSTQGLQLSDIKNFIFHPGGKKVLQAYTDALDLDPDSLQATRSIMNQYGNMSGTTVLYVLEHFLREGYQEGHGLMLAMGPGFSSEMVLLHMNQ